MSAVDVELLGRRPFDARRLRVSATGARGGAGTAVVGLIALCALRHRR